MSGFEAEARGAIPSSTETPLRDPRCEYKQGLEPPLRATHVERDAQPPTVKRETCPSRDRGGCSAFPASRLVGGAILLDRQPKAPAHRLDRPPNGRWHAQKILPVG